MRQQQIDTLGVIQIKIAVTLSRATMRQAKHRLDPRQRQAELGRNRGVRIRPVVVPKCLPYVSRKRLVRLDRPTVPGRRFLVATLTEIDVGQIVQRFLSFGRPCPSR